MVEPMVPLVTSTPSLAELQAVVRGDVHSAGDPK